MTLYVLRNKNLPDNGSISDAWVRDEQGFELSGGHLEALVLDDLLEPVDDEDLIVIVNVPDIAGV